MSSAIFGPENFNITLYSGDSAKINFRVYGPDNSSYVTTGSWQFKVFNAENGDLIWENNSGSNPVISASPRLNSAEAGGIVEISLNRGVTNWLAASVVYELSLVHDGRNERFTFLKGDISVDSKVSAVSTG